MFDNCAVVNLVSSPEDHLKGFQSTCAELLSRNELVDCTLCCSNGQVQAHRVILACSSPYIHELLSTTSWPSPCSHPMLFFKSISVEDMRLALEFIYTGKTQVAKSKLSMFMSLFQDLGCSSLTKVIEKALQSSPMESFSNGQRRSQNQRLGSGTPTRHKPFLNETQTQHLRTIESCNDDITQNNIKIEQSEQLSSSGSSPSTPSQSILRSSLTPPLQLRRQSPTQHFAAAKRNQERTISATSPFGESYQYSLPDPFSNGTEYQDKNCNAASVNSGDSEVCDDTSAEFFGMANEAEEEDDDGNGSIGIEDNDPNQMDDDEMPITVIDLKSLAELETTTDSVKNDTRKTSLEKTEVLPANCPWCLKVFTSLTLLQRHIKTHVGNYKPYACEYCTATFARTAHLKRHIRTHTGEKPFVCGICQKAFSRQDKLKTHLERHVHGTYQMGQYKGSSNGSDLGKITNARAPTFNDGKTNQSATPLIYPFINSNNTPNRNWSSSLPDRYSNGINQHDNQKLVSSSTISPSTTITPISALPADQMEMHNC